MHNLPKKQQQSSPTKKEDKKVYPPYDPKASATAKEKRSVEDLESKPFECILCEYKASRKAYLTDHMRTHTGQRPYHCQFCSYRSADRSTLTRHVKVHKGIKPYACSQCDYKASRHSHLIRHMLTHKEKPPCEKITHRKSPVRIAMRPELVGANITKQPLTNSGSSQNRQLIIRKVLFPSPKVAEQSSATKSIPQTVSVDPSTKGSANSSLEVVTQQRSSLDDQPLSAGLKRRSGNTSKKEISPNKLKSNLILRPVMIQKPVKEVHPGFSGTKEMGVVRQESRRSIDNPTPAFNFMKAILKKEVSVKIRRLDERCFINYQQCKNLITTSKSKSISESSNSNPDSSISINLEKGGPQQTIHKESKEPNGSDCLQAIKTNGPTMPQTEDKIPKMTPCIVKITSTSNSKPSTKEQEKDSMIIAADKDLNHLESTRCIKESGLESSMESKKDSHHIDNNNNGKDSSIYDLSKKRPLEISSENPIRVSRQDERNILDDRVSLKAGIRDVLEPALKELPNGRSRKYRSFDEKKQDLPPKLLNHLVEKPYRCPECDYTNTARSKIISHFVIHLQIKPYKCSLCDHRATRQSNLDDHMRTHTGQKPYGCSFCEYRSSDKSTLTRHLRRHTGEKPFRCQLCDYKGTRQQHLLRHMSRAHRVGYLPGETNDPDYSSTSKDRFSDDDSQFSGDLNEEVDRYLIGEISLQRKQKSDIAELENISFPDKRSEEHSQESASLLDLNPTGNSGASSDAESQGLNPEAGDSESSAEEEDISRDDGTDDDQNDANMETQEETNRTDLSMLSDEDIIAAPFELESSIEEKIFRCPRCEHEVPEEHLYSIQVKAPANVGQLKCKQCDYHAAYQDFVIFQSRPRGEKKTKLKRSLYDDILPDLPNELRQIIRLGKPYHCPLCDFDPTTRSSLVHHYASFHMEVKPFKCPHCPFSGARPVNLADHLRMHTGEKPYPCSHCDYKAADRSTLTRHVRIHTGLKPFQCPQCDYRASRNHHLTRHLLRHKTERR